MKAKTAVLLPLAGAFCLLWALSMASAVQERLDPAQSLQRAVDAYLAHDQEAFARYVDSEKVVSQGVRDYLRSSLARSLSNNNPAEAKLNEYAVMLMAPGLTAEVMDELSRAVSRGDVVPDGVEPEDFNVSEAVHGPSGDAGRKFFRGLESVRVQGGQAVARLGLHHPGLGMDLPLDLRLENRGDHWQVVEVTNVDENVGRVMDAVGPGMEGVGQ